MAENSAMPYMPRLEMVKVPPENSCGLSLLALACARCRPSGRAPVSVLGGRRHARRDAASQAQRVMLDRALSLTVASNRHAARRPLSNTVC